MKPFTRPFHASASLAVILALLTVTIALAASGDLDTTFSGDGKIIQSFGGTSHIGRDTAVQSDGKVLVVGEKVTSVGRDMAIARYNTDGSPDTTFSEDGKLVVNIGTYDQAYGVVIQTDGKIVVGGQSCTPDFVHCDVAVVRLNTNGTLDITFSGDGKVTTDVGGGDNGGWDITLQGSKIVVAGYLHDGTSYNGAVYRYNANGSLDPTFSGDGILPINFGQDEYLNAVTVYSGKIYIAGHSEPSDGSTADFITARINSNGTLDAAFSGDGKVKTNLGGLDSAGGLVISGGKVVVAGFSDDNIAIVQYTASGDLDSTFSGDGKLKSNLGYSSASLSDIAIQGGKIVVTGSVDPGAGRDGLLARYTATGLLDTTFGTNGIVITDWAGNNDYYYSVVFRNARIYVVGWSIDTSNTRRFIIAAYLP